MKSNARGGGAVTKIPLLWKVQIGAYAAFLATSAIGLYGLTIFCLGEYDARLKWLDFPVFSHPISRIICDLGVVSYICLIVIFVIFRKSFGQNAPQIADYLENCGKKAPDQASDRV